MIRSKLPDVGTTIFTVMSRLAIEHKAINLGQGFPDFDPDPALCALVSRPWPTATINTPTCPASRRCVKPSPPRRASCNGHAYDPETEITVTSGATEALMATVLAAVGSGDEVVVIEPCYDSYLPAIRLAGGTAVPVPLRAPTADDPYLPHRLAVRDAITPKTRLLMLNFPHNPTGAVLDDGDLDALEAIVRDTGVLLLSDEVYEHIVFDGKPHASVARRPLLADHAFVISSFGKTYHTTGWKIGYRCAPRQLSAELRKVHQFMVFTVPSPMQYALAEFMRDPKPYLDLPAFYQAKRDRRPKAWPRRASAPAQPRHVLPAGRLQRYLQAGRSRLRARPDREPRRHRDSRVGLLPPTRRAGIQSPHRALLLRQEGRDAGCRAGAACLGVVQTLQQPERARQMARSFHFHQYEQILAINVSQAKPARIRA